MGETSHSVGKKVAETLWAAFLAFVILVVGQAIWGLLLAANFKKSTKALPWCVIAMAVVLWLFWQYLGGRWAPRRTSPQRKQLLRANPVSLRQFVLAFLAGTLSIVALAAYWIVFSQLSKTAPNRLEDASKYPLLTVVLVVSMSSLVSPVVEEIAFRGYCQGILERHFSGVTAVVLSSLLFMLAHTNHGLYWTKLSVYFMAGIVFGTIALLTNSILTSLPVHVVGDLTFFFLIWPKDSQRLLVNAGGADKWFWVHVAQGIAFTLAALVVFLRLAKRNEPAASAVLHTAG